MKYIRYAGYFLLVSFIFFSVAGLSTWFYFNPWPHHQQLFVNGTILTMDSNNSSPEAMLVEGSRILATGTREEMARQASISAVEIDLQGKTLLPGFIEAHGHFPASGLDAITANLYSPPAGDVRTITEAVDKLHVQAEEDSSKQWILGTNYDDTLLTDQRTLNRFDLDKVSIDRPVFVSHVSGHMAIINSVGIDELAIAGDTKSPFGGEIVRDNSGQLTGILKGTAQNKARQTALEFSITRLIKALANSIEDYLVEGVTTVQNGMTRPSLYYPLSLLAATGVIPQRLVLWPNEKLAATLKSRPLFPQSVKVKEGAVKLVTDGSIQIYTAFLNQPYLNTPEGKPDDFRGYPAQQDDDFTRRVIQWHSQGKQIAFHANGDAAIERVLNAVAKAQNQKTRSDPRHILVHVQMATPDQLKRMIELGVTPSFFASHIFYWGDRHTSLFLGKDRAEKLNPLNSAFQKGVRFTIHNDSPITPVNSMKLLASAVQRKTRSGQVLGEQEQITVLQALRAMTIDAAWQIFMEKDIGSLEPGKLADFVILSENPLANPDELENIRIEQTWIGGVKRYNRESVDPLQASEAVTQAQP